MTLVVAAASDDFAFLVADTLLSFEFHINDRAYLVGQELHALKIQILNPHTAIAYAGDVSTSCDLIRNIYIELSTNPDIDVCKRLFELYTQAISEKENPPDCEFLVLKLKRSENRLAKITRDGVFPCTRAYIGDSDEYRRMVGQQEEYNPQISMSPCMIESVVVSRAMENLTSQRQSNSVGAMSGLVTRVVTASRSGELEYLQTYHAQISITGGDCGFSYVSSNSNVRGIGIYYPEGRMGFLFIVGDTEYGRKEYADTLDLFKEAAKTRYGLFLE